MKIKTIVAAALLGAALGAQAQDKWMIGQSVPLTGGNAQFGKDIRLGAQAYFAQLNARGGVQGKAVELVSLDDRNERKQAAANAKQLLDDKHLLALFGFASATLSLDALPQAHEKGVPFFAPFSGANAVRGTSPVLFTVRASYGEEMEKMLNFWVSLGFKRVTVVHYDDEVGKQNLEVVSQYLKKVNLSPQALPLKRNAVVGKAEVDALVAQQPEVVLNTVLSGAAAALQKEMVAMGKLVPTSSLSFVGADQYISAAGIASSGVSIAQVVPSPNSTLPIVRECAQAVQAAGAKVMNTTQLEACMAAKVLAEGIRRAKRPIHAQHVLEALSNMGSYDLGGYKITFNPGQQHGSRFVELAMVTREGKLSSR
jgi:ABC-type branched-subunit amino acid transport system substrate-binding protein